MKIDSHQHFWKYETMRDKSWINDSMSVLKKDFSPEEVKPLMDENKIGGGIAVQADQTEEETFYLLDLAKQFNLIKGVVGWIDFKALDIRERLEYFSKYKVLKGFRHIIQAEKDDNFILDKKFCNGISLLKDYDFTYDILIYPRHLKYALEFVEQFPDQKFVIDHLAKPFIKAREVNEWKKEIEGFKTKDNVYCKIAGLTTEADWANWKTEDFNIYISTVIDVFGIDRVMFGSDWPVCLPSATYSQVCEILESNTYFLDQEEKDKLWGKNAMQFYGL